MVGAVARAASRREQEDTTSPARDRARNSAWRHPRGGPGCGAEPARGTSRSRARRAPSSRRGGHGSGLRPEASARSVVCFCFGGREIALKSALEAPRSAHLARCRGHGRSPVRHSTPSPGAHTRGPSRDAPCALRRDDRHLAAWGARPRRRQRDAQEARFGRRSRGRHRERRTASSWTTPLSCASRSTAIGLLARTRAPSTDRPTRAAAREAEHGDHARRRRPPAPRSSCSGPRARAPSPTGPQDGTSSRRRSPRVSRGAPCRSSALRGEELGLADRRLRATANRLRRGSEPSPAPTARRAQSAGGQVALLQRALVLVAAVHARPSPGRRRGARSSPPASTGGKRSARRQIMKANETRRARRDPAPRLRSGSTGHQAATTWPTVDQKHSRPSRVRSIRARPVERRSFGALTEMPGGDGGAWSLARTHAGGLGGVRWGPPSGVIVGEGLPAR